jgi:hypothetical protein
MWLRPKHGRNFSPRAGFLQSNRNIRWKQFPEVYRETEYPDDGLRLRRLGGRGPGDAARAAIPVRAASQFQFRFW